MKKNSLSVIQSTLKSDDTMSDLILAGSLDTSAKGKNEAKKYVASILGEIERSVGTKFDLTECSPDSIRQTLIDSMRFKIPIDGRKMAYIESRWNKEKGCSVAGLQITTNGLVAKITEHFPDFIIKSTPVFTGDDLVIKNGGKVEHTQKDPFCSDLTKLEGMVVESSYTNNGRLVEDATVVTKKDLLSMKAASKAQNIWNTWTIERMKTAAIKRICKWQFRAIQGVQEIIDYDNNHNYNMDTDINVKSNTIIDNINNMIDDEEVINVDEEPVDIKSLESDGYDAAHDGLVALGEWAETLTDKEKGSIKHKGKEWNKIAKEADLADNGDDEDMFVVA